MQDLECRVAVVTGGASGIGPGMAKAILKKGLKIAIADIHFCDGGWTRKLIEARTNDVFDAPSRRISQ
jgi:NAD(P)-dependent dehydrogenase (short-subunit alcohol dehydrogenase family)